mmetsp:Transcript_11718/g.19897  ORF Transcript_11718/g.19897 Transcript_11718/m.19897 type:complete len:234 (-) Transcript_11718:486-1187(-)
MACSRKISAGSLTDTILRDASVSCSIARAACAAADTSVDHCTPSSALSSSSSSSFDPSFSSLSSSRVMPFAAASFARRLFSFRAAFASTSSFSICSLRARLASFLAAFSAASTASPASRRSCSARRNFLASLSFLPPTPAGGFLRMKVVSLWRISTWETFPQALHWRVIFSPFAIPTSVSGFPQAKHCTKRLMKPSRRLSKMALSCAPFTIDVPVFSSNLDCAPNSHPKYFVV